MNKLVDFVFLIGFWSVDAVDFESVVPAGYALCGASSFEVGVHLILSSVQKRFLHSLHWYHSWNGSAFFWMYFSTSSRSISFRFIQVSQCGQCGSVGLVAIAFQICWVVIFIGVSSLCFERRRVWLWGSLVQVLLSVGLDVAFDCSFGGVAFLAEGDPVYECFVGESFNLEVLIADRVFGCGLADVAVE